jgi:hypothetical protein
VNLAVEPSFTLSGLRSTAKIHDAENNHSVGIDIFVPTYQLRNSALGLHSASPLLVDESAAHPAPSARLGVGDRSFSVNMTSGKR